MDRFGGGRDIRKSDCKSGKWELHSSRREEDGRDAYSITGAGKKMSSKSGYWETEKRGRAAMEKSTTEKRRVKNFTWKNHRHTHEKKSRHCPDRVKESFRSGGEECRRKLSSREKKEKCTKVAVLTMSASGNRETGHFGEGRRRGTNFVKANLGRWRYPESRGTGP